MSRTSERIGLVVMAAMTAAAVAFMVWGMLHFE